METKLFFLFIGRWRCTHINSLKPKIFESIRQHKIKYNNSTGNILQGNLEWGFQVI